MLKLAGIISDSTSSNIFFQFLVIFSIEQILVLCIFYAEYRNPKQLQNFKNSVPVLCCIIYVRSRGKDMEILSYSHLSPNLSTMIIADKRPCNQFFLTFRRFSPKLSTDVILSTKRISTRRNRRFITFFVDMKH